MDVSGKTTEQLVRELEAAQARVNELEQLLAQRSAGETELVQREAAELLAHADALSVRTQLATLLESIPDALLILDRDWRYVYLNAKAEQNVRKTRAELLGRNIWEVFPETLDTIFYREYHRAFAEQVSVTFEAFYPLLNDWYAVYIYPTPAGLSIYYRDITERKREEEERARLLLSEREASKKVTRILESLTDAFFALDLQWRFTYLNSQAEHLLFRSREELLTKNVWDEFPEAVGSDFYQQSHRALAEQVSVSFEAYYPLLASWFEVRAYPTAEGLSVYFHNITERREAEKTLRLSEARFRRLANANMIGLIFAHFDGRITEANDAFLGLVGYTREDLEAGAVRWDWMTPPEYDALDKRAIEQLRTTGVQAPFEKEYLHKGGSRVPVLLGSAVLEEGEEQTISFVLNLSERKNAEAALAEQARLSALTADVGNALIQSEAMSESLRRCAEAVVAHLDAAFARVWILNPVEQVLELVASAGLYTHMNGAHSRVPLGELKIGRIAQEKMPYLTNAVLGDPEVKEQEWARREGMVAFAGYPLIVNERAVGVLALFARHPLSDTTLQALGSVATNIALAIDRYRVAQERAALLIVEQHAREKAEAAPARLTFLAEASLLLGSSLDYETTLEHVSRLAIQYLADYCLFCLIEKDSSLRFLSAHRDPGKEALALDLQRRYPSDPSAGEVNRRVLATCRGEISSMTHALLAASPQDEGHLAWLRALDPKSVMVVPLLARSKPLGTLTFVSTESTQRYNSEDLALAEELGRRASLAVQNAQLFHEAEETVRIQKELDYLKDLFVSIATHELRTPVTAIKGFAQLLRRTLNRQIMESTAQVQLPDPAQPTEVLQKNLASIETILRQTNRMSALVTQLLDLSRLQQGSLELQYKQQANLVELVNWVVEQQRLTDPEHMLTLSIGEETLTASYDEGRIEQVLTNLIGNAIKYSPAGSLVLVGLERRRAAEREEALLWVKDEGSGIPFEHQPHLFDRYYRIRTKENARVDDLGLGLYISYEIVKQYGGRIWVESEPNKGSTFFVSLPLERQLRVEE